LEYYPIFFGFGLQQILNGIPLLLIKIQNVKWYYHFYFGAMATICQTFGKLSVLVLLLRLNEEKIKY